MLLKRQGIIETWHDRRLNAGDELKEEIDSALEDADIVLLLVSADFIASSYCYEAEMTRALERHKRGEARVIPIILRHCDWQSAPFGTILTAPKDGKPVTSWPDIDEAFADVARMVRQAAAAGRAAPRSVEPTHSRPALVAQVVRSSNLRLKKTFSDADRDQFELDAFEFMARYFEGSLSELEARNTGVTTTFRRLDANHFTAVIYINGKAEARCKITLGSGIGRGGIAFSHDDHAAQGSFNETMSVASDEQSLFLRPLGMADMGNQGARNLTHEGAAEYYWSLFIRWLQP